MDLTARIKKCQNLLKERELDGVLITDPPTLYYLTGKDLSLGYLFVLRKHVHLLVDGRYFESCVKSVPMTCSLLKKKALQKVLESKSFQTLEKLGIDSSVMSHGEFLRLRKDCNAASRCRSGGKIQILSQSSFGHDLRLVKDEKEVRCLKQAAHLGSRGYDFLCQRLRNGVTEKELAKELEIFFLQNGGEGLSFDPIVAFGTHTSMPHYHPQNTKLKPGMPVLFDIGVMKQHYASDMTRVVFWGSPKEKMYDIYSVVLQAFQAAVAQGKPGESVASLDYVAREVIKEAGYGDYFTHSLGHGVGLEVHEAPGLRNTPELKKVPLQVGMVITIEPGIYLPKIGGVRLEDTFVMREKGLESLTKRSLKLKEIAPRDSCLEL